MCQTIVNSVRLGLGTIKHHVYCFNRPASALTILGLQEGTFPATSLKLLLNLSQCNHLLGHVLRQSMCVFILFLSLNEQCIIKVEPAG